MDAWSVDEIVILDVTRTVKGIEKKFYKVVKEFARNCFVPLSVGGGIRTIEDVRLLLSLGADKVVLNTAAIEQPSFITEIANLYGSQCVILSIDAAKTGEEAYEVHSHFGSRPTGFNPSEWAKRGEELGAGEILVTSIEKDGSLMVTKRRFVGKWRMKFQYRS